MSGFLRLTYVSRSVAPLGRERLANLLQTSETHNAVLGITGVLCAGRNHFMQTLEGIEEHVINLYARILRDERHRDCALLDIGLVDTPMFERWSMGFVDGDSLDPRLLDHMLELRTAAQRRDRTAALMQAFLERLRNPSQPTA
ncbi:MAG: BLUF domain-containing protein [Azoarcus sp.]|nr:BLUF domain-containing protein [Azoarcus sp.]